MMSLSRLHLRSGSKCLFFPSCTQYFYCYCHLKSCLLYGHYLPVESWVSFLILRQYPYPQICHHGCFQIGVYSHVALHVGFSVSATVEN
uniref:Uncharacterized protein n=1 Tax=Populus trichocarpa TaxID=3694 RepID=A0A2K2B790_POPTR